MNDMRQMTMLGRSMADAVATPAPDRALLAATTPLSWRTWTTTRPAPDSSANSAAALSAHRLSAVPSTPTTIGLAMVVLRSRYTLA